MMGVDDRNLLVISHNYNDFVKDLTETVQPSLGGVSVCVRYNYPAHLLSYLPMDHYKKFTPRRHLDLQGTDPHITTYLTPLIYGPSEREYARAGDRHSRSLFRTIARHGIAFDLIHAHFTWSAGYAGARLRETSGQPLVVTAHGYDIYSLPFKSPAWRERIAAVLQTADQIITVSQRNRRCIEELEVTTPVTVIPNGFRSDRFNPRNPGACRRILGLPEDRRIILTVGSLESVKGQRYLLEALCAVKSVRKDFLCVIVGVGRLRSALEDRCRSLGLGEHVLFAGGKPHDEIPLWMNACDIFVLSSLDEGNPTVMFEALGCGKPFVGTRVGGVPEVITSDRYGLLVDPADPPDLAEKILTALDREWDRGAILHHAGQYTWEGIAGEVLKVYSKTERRWPGKK